MAVRPPASFLQFLSTAKGSVGERKDQRYCALDENDITPAQFDQTYRLADATSRLIGGFMTYLRRTAMTGHKFDTRSSPANSKRKTQNPKPLPARALP